MNIETCKNCFFSAIAEKVQTICRRYPPTVLPTTRQNPVTRQMEMGLMSTFAGTPPDEWCGEYRAKTRIQ